MMSIKFGRFECTIGGSNKFWECLPEKGGLYSIRYGVIGSAGQTSRPLSYVEAAKRISEKISKGYVWVSGEEIDDEEKHSGIARSKKNPVLDSELDFDFHEELKKLG